MSNIFCTYAEDWPACVEHFGTCVEHYHRSVEEFGICGEALATPWGGELWPSIQTLVSRGRITLRRGNAGARPAPAPGAARRPPRPASRGRRVEPASAAPNRNASSVTSKRWVQSGVRQSCRILTPVALSFVHIPSFLKSPFSVCLPLAFSLPPAADASLFASASAQVRVCVGRRASVNLTGNGKRDQPFVGTDEEIEKGGPLLHR